MTFIPSDTAVYGSVTAHVYVQVTRRVPAISWANPAPIADGTALSAIQLNAAADVPGKFTYLPQAGSVLSAGTQKLSVTFTPNDSINYCPVTPHVYVQVARRVPAISWTTPASIVYGTALSAIQLNAAANVPGRFTYSPQAGTVLSAGTQKLSVTFTPGDLINYCPVTAHVYVKVIPPTRVGPGGQTKTDELRAQSVMRSRS